MIIIDEHDGKFKASDPSIIELVDCLNDFVTNAQKIIESTDEAEQEYGFRGMIDCFSDLFEITIDYEGEPMYKSLYSKIYRLDDLNEKK